MAIETTEALEEYAHRQIRLELDIAAEDSPYVLDLFHGSYQGARFRFGDAACPDLAALAKLRRLLEPERIGVELSEGISTDAGGFGCCDYCASPRGESVQCKIILNLKARPQKTERP